MIGIKEFAAKHNLSLEAFLVRGAHGSIRQFDAERFAVTIEIDWKQARKVFIAHSFTFQQDNGSSGIALFDPNNTLQVEIALKLAVCQQAFAFK